MIIFRKPIKIMTEEDRGMVPYSIVVFEKRPWMYNARVLPNEEARQKGYEVEQIVTQYRYHLMIDLWIIILRFNWESKLK